MKEPLNEERAASPAWLLGHLDLTSAGRTRSLGRSLLDFVSYLEEKCFSFVFSASCLLGLNPTLLFCFVLPLKCNISKEKFSPTIVAKCNVLHLDSIAAISAQSPVLKAGNRDIWFSGILTSEVKQVKCII